MTDRPPEFEEDLIALDAYRNPRMVQIFPDPRLMKAMQQQATAQFMVTVFVSAVIFILIVAAMA